MRRLMLLTAMILPWAAKIQTKLHALFPGLATDLAGLVNRMLPQPGGVGTTRVVGALSESHLRPQFAVEANEAAARANNEVSS